jgi:GNAT superfamily N-acetyltransferase
LFREQATDDDVLFARKTLLSEKMNPLSLSKRTLMVAYDPHATTKSGGRAQNIDIVGFGQIRPTSDNTYQELASLYVLPEYRNQKVGSAIVQRLLEGFDSENDDHATSTTPGVTCCLLTLRPTIPLYSQFGFVEVKKIFLAHFKWNTRQVSYYLFCWETI